MKRKLSIFGVLVVVGVMVLALAQTRSAVAIEPGKYLVEGNPSCETLNDDPKFDNIISDFGFKIDGQPIGANLYFTLTPGPQNGLSTVLTGGAPSDPNNSVTITSNGYVFDWDATIGMDAVIVKGGQDSTAYVYVPEAYQGDELTTPGGQAISHIEFCYDYKLTATKTANAEYIRTYTWDITKDFDGDYSKFIGEPAAVHPYKVSVDQSVTDSDYAVSGEIVVSNPTPYTVEFSVSDMVDGVAATVICSSYSLPPGGSVTCSYSAPLSGAIDGTNIATITSNTLTVDGATAKADYTFGDPTDIVGYPTINVTDTNGGSWTASSDAFWEYTKDFLCPTDLNLYVNGVYAALDYVNTASIDEISTESDTATVKLTCYAPVVSKDAEAEWYKTIDWTIVKSVTPPSADRFAGESAEFEYTIDVIKSESFGPYVVSGKIYISNPAGAPGAITVDVTDSVAGTPATVDCGSGLTSVTVAAGDEEVCTYTANLSSNTDGINTARATFNEIDFEAEAAYVFGDPTLSADSEPESITVDDTNNKEWATSASSTWNYSEVQSCSNDASLYAGDGFYSKDFGNTATINETDESDRETVTLNCYAPVVSKNATAEWKQKYDWTITKTADPDAHVGFAGDSFVTNYDVFVDQKITEYGFKAYGTISVSNPAGAPAAITVNVSDAVNGTVASVDCDLAAEGSQASLTVAAGATGTCEYTVDLGDNTDLTNTATVSFNTIDFAATALVDFGDPIIEGYPTINVTDTYKGALGSTSGDFTFEYSRTFNSSLDPADYTDGVDIDIYPNTATIVETGQEADEEVSVTCYAPVVTKDAAASYDKTHTWDIVKTVDPESQSGFAGETLGWTWTVNVSESFIDSNFAVSGKIYVTNPAGKPMTVSLTDELDDGTTATISGCTNGTYLAGELIVAAGQTSVCDYSAAPTGKTSTLNTATATLNGIDFDATADVDFVARVIEGTANVSDDQIGLDQGLTAGEGPWEFTGFGSHTCSSVQADYGTAGTYSGDEENLASVVGIDGQTDSDNASTSFDCYAPVVSKTAEGAYVERHEWTVEKSVTPLSQSAFAGDTVEFDWTITVQEEVTEESFEVSGVITVINTNPDDSLVVSLVDMLNDVSATEAVITPDADCDYEIANGELTVRAGSTATCDYTASPNGYSATKNTVTATLNGIDFNAEDMIEWEADVVRGSATLNDNQYPYDGESVNDAWTDTYEDSYTCSSTLSDYTNGADLDNQVVNTAEVYSEGSLQDSATATTEIDCYIPSITKTAEGAYVERHEWDVEKTVAPLSQSGFAGQTVDFQWTINVTEDIFEENFDVSGTITVNNPNPEDVLVVSLVDWVNGHQAAIDGTSCAFVGGNLTINANSSETCDYEINDLPYSDVDLAPTLNTATIVLNSISFSASDHIEWIPDVIRGDATLDDEQYPYEDEAVDGGWEETYNDTYTCSSDLDDYTNGEYLGNLVDNTAIIYSGDVEQNRDTATTEIDCYAPVVTKDAAASYDETHTWEISKSVDPTSQKGYPGDLLEWTWTVIVSETSADSNFLVKGSIYVKNPNPDASMTVDVSDVLEDGTIADVDCGEDSTSLTVAAGETGTCSYTANPAGKTAELNTGMATLNGIAFTGMADVSFVKKVIGGTATVTDDQIGLNKDLSAGSGPWTFSKTGNHTCSLFASDYGADGTYSSTLSNTADLIASNSQTASVSASTTYTCEAGFVDLFKLTEGIEDPDLVWSFTLYLGPDGFDKDPQVVVGTGSTPPSLINFGGPALRPDKTYTICELGVPSGWEAFWMKDSIDVTLGVYNPNADDAIPEDVGNRCIDFGVTAREVIHFEVDNFYPGGQPRTPGYWKNWSTCSGGNQVDTAAANGGWEEGFWLLDDVLDPAIGGGIVWDVILDDDFWFPIDTCQVAVDILNSRDIVDGENKSNDAAYKLARNLLAAQANFAAGARICNAVEYAALAAEELMDKYDFNGTGSYLSNQDKLLRDDYEYAKELAGTLDLYNNGLLCIGPDVDDPPMVIITSPLDGSVVNGSLTIEALTFDDYEVTNVEFFIDADTEPIATSIKGFDDWSIVWDTNGVSDGEHLLTARATDNAGQSDADSILFTVDNTPDPIVTLVEMSASSVWVKSNSWKAIVSVTLDTPGAIVSGTWSNGAVVSCTTDVFGTCTVELNNISKKTSYATFTLDNGYILNGISSEIQVNRPE